MVIDFIDNIALVSDPSLTVEPFAASLDDRGSRVITYTIAVYSFRLDRISTDAIRSNRVFILTNNARLFRNFKPNIPGQIRVRQILGCA